MFKWSLLIVAFFPVVCGATEKALASLTIYTSRKTHLIEPLLKAYTKKTGVMVKHINGKAGVLVQKIKQEGSQTKADLLITVDAGNLDNASDLGLLSTLTAKSLLQKVSAENRGKNNDWIGLALRARTLFYNKNRVKKADLKSYADLAGPQWKGKLCLRTSRKVYNQSLVAAMIHKYGTGKTKRIVSGWVSNLAKPVFTNDTKLLEAIDKGICQVGIANTYYMARLVKKGEAKNVDIFWPSKKEGGVHVNVSGAGIIKASKNKEQAEKLLEWLVTDEAQQMFAALNDEYPVVKDVKVSGVLKQWGPFQREATPLNAIGPLQKKAVLLMDAAKYQ